MEFSCVICAEVQSLSEVRNLVDISTIFYKLTALEVAKLDNIHQLLKVCSQCYGKFVDFDSFRTLCLVAYEKLTQFQTDSLKVCTKEIEELADHPECEKEEHHIYSPADNELLEKVVVVEIDSSNYDTLLEHESDVSDDSDEEDSTTLDSTDPTVPSIRNDTKTADNEESKQNRRALNCDLCDRKFRSQDRLEGHIREHQGLKPALCQICGKSFTDWKNLKRHKDEKHLQRNQGVFRCDYEGCTSSFSSSKVLNAHKKRHDPNYVKPVPKPCICETCGITYSSKGALKKHLYIHTGGMPFHCEKCNKSYPTAYKLKVHIMRHQGIKNYECSYCGLKKTTADELKLHMNYHTKEKVFNCHFCGQTFLTSGNFSRHVKLVHRGEKEFKCTYCVRSFGKAETLKNHVMTHTGEKPYKCTICSKQFIQAHSLQIHIKTHDKKGGKSKETTIGTEVQFVASSNGGE
ncbi:zinc finger protein draculin [Anopheles maculipalpis]|uniref:zinc finger protein draculin n=1 Tax=Anopheles maculipalpis TaxID=1496333 RepID=UPI0021592A11|nr:zinc finger protein draculin [Anopheles maculipalpis]